MFSELSNRGHNHLRELSKNHYVCITSVNQPSAQSVLARVESLLVDVPCLNEIEFRGLTIGVEKG